MCKTVIPPGLHTKLLKWGFKEKDDVYVCGDVTFTYDGESYTFTEEPKFRRFTYKKVASTKDILFIDDIYYLFLKVA